MGGHALRGALTAWLSLIALQAIVTSGSGKVAGVFAGVSSLIDRALDPSVPAIPDRRVSAPAAGAQSMTNPFLPSAVANPNPSQVPGPGRVVPQ